MRYQRRFHNLAAAWEKRKAQSEARKAELAELVAQGLSLSAAAKHIGVTQQQASKLFAAIRAEMGWQAV